MDVEGGPPAGPSLEGLLREAREAELPTRLVAYRDLIAAHGQTAIDAIGPWLSDSRDAYFAVAVIERIGRDPRARAKAVQALRRGRSEANDPSLRGFVDAALKRMGERISSRPPKPEWVDIASAFQVAPPFRVAHHVVVDHVPDSGTRWHDIYLFACGWFFSGQWVRKNGGLKDLKNLNICAACRNAVERGG